MREKAELSHNAIENESSYVDTFGSDDFKYLKWKRGVGERNSILSATTDESVASIETLKGGQCEMSAVTLAPILLWLSSSVISSNAGNGTDSPSCGEDSGGWWSGSCSPASQNDITVREQQQQTMQNV